MAQWRYESLKKQYGERYRWAGEYLGNVNFRTDKPIKLANPTIGIRGLKGYLRIGYNLILMCGCRDYEACHLHEIVTLLQQADPSIKVVHPETIPSPGTIKCISIRQPWAWIILHPRIVADCGLEPKYIENRQWKNRYRGPLLIHAGVKVDEDLFERGKLDRSYWTYQFGAAGAKLAAAMPQHKDEYAKRAIVGSAELVDVVEYSESIWYVLGSYGFILQNPQPLNPISYPGQQMLFNVPLSLVSSRVESEVFNG
jgi:hypothetical protein